MKLKEINRFKDLLDHSSSFLCVSHESPDGDTISSALGLGLSLRASGKTQVDFYCSDEIPYNFGFLPGACEFKTSPPKKKYDVVIGFDAAKKSRLSLANVEYDVIVCVDHHRLGEHYGDINLISINQSATTQVCFDIIKKLKLPMSRDIATNLYTGLYTDTGGFKYGTTNQKSFYDAGRLTKLEANPWFIYSNIYENHPPERIKLLSRVLASLELKADGKLALLSLDEKDLKELNCNLDMTDGFINYARGIAGVEIAALLFKTEEEVRIDFRGKGKVNVGELIKPLGANGKPNAGSVIIKGSLKNARDKVIKTLVPLF